LQKMQQLVGIYSKIEYVTYVQKMHIANSSLFQNGTT